MCVLDVSFGSKVRPITFWFVAMGNAVLFIFRSRLLLYLHLLYLLYEQSASCFVWIWCEIVLFCQGKHVMYVFLGFVLVCVEVVSSAYAKLLSSLSSVSAPRAT